VPAVGRDSACAACAASAANAKEMAAAAANYCITVIGSSGVKIKTSNTLPEVIADDREEPAYLKRTLFNAHLT
jgi:hypothetical protein